MSVARAYTIFMALPDKNENYKDKTYWDHRYTTEKSYDWFAKYSAFRCHIVTTVKQEDNILMLGNLNLSLSLRVHIICMKHL